MIPRLHQSTDLLCPRPSKISGATYSLVPLKDAVKFDAT